MEIISAAAPEIWRQEPGFVGLCEHVARCAAICYNSTPKKGGAAVDFVKMLARKGHGRALEFGTLHFVGTPYSEFRGFEGCVFCDPRDPRSTYANLRVTLETYGSLDEIEEFADGLTGDIGDCPFATVHYPAIARSIADEFRTHTTLSTLMQSTRYVKYDDVEFVAPSWLATAKEEERGAFVAGLDHAAALYRYLLDLGHKPQEAREVLPLCVKTEMVQYGFVGDSTSGWGNFLRLRTAKEAHPDAQAMAKEVHRILNDDATTIRF